MPSIVSDPVSKNNLVDLVSKILLQKILVNSSLHVYDNLTIFSNSRQFKNSFATLQLNSQHFHSMSLFYKGKNLKYFVIFVSWRYNSLPIPDQPFQIHGSQLF